MTQEEKAKRYDEAIKVAQRFYNNSVAVTKKGLEDIFPELAGSEDERIRKAIIEFFELQDDNTTYSFIPKKDILAWLEKIGKNTTNKGEPNLLTHERVMEISPFMRSGFENEDKVKPKFKVGDVMRTLQEASDGIKDGLPVVVSIDDECYHCNNEIIPIADQENYEYPPKNRKQSIAWSEEDTFIINKILYICNYYEKSFEHTSFVRESIKEDVNKIDNWLKSLKDRYTWKPSEIQLETLKELSHDFPTKIGIIEEILKHLKQL